jgi:hypothetical protein
MHQQTRGGWVVVNPGKASPSEDGMPLTSGICFSIFMITYLYKLLISSLRTLYKGWWSSSNNSMPT